MKKFDLVRFAHERNGGPAFPNSVQPDFQYAEAGMSLRDWFAGQALAGWLASFGETTSPKADKCAAFAYEMADAMLAERAEAENANG